MASGAGFDYEVFAPVPASDFAPPASSVRDVELHLEDGQVSARVNFGQAFKLVGLRTLGKSSGPEDARAALDLLRSLREPPVARSWAEKVKLYKVVYTKGSPQVAEPEKAAVVAGSLQFEFEAQNPVTLDGKQLKRVYLFRDLDTRQAYVHFVGQTPKASVLLFSDTQGPELFKDVDDASALKQAGHPNLHIVGAAAFQAQAMRLTK
jgi:hypothetical protein